MTLVPSLDAPWGADAYECSEDAGPAPASPVVEDILAAPSLATDSTLAPRRLLVERRDESVSRPSGTAAGGVPVPTQSGGLVQIDANETGVAMPSGRPGEDLRAAEEAAAEAGERPVSTTGSHGRRSSGGRVSDHTPTTSHGTVPLSSEDSTESVKPNLNDHGPIAKNDSEATPSEEEETESGRHKEAGSCGKCGGPKRGHVSAEGVEEASSHSTKKPKGQVNEGGAQPAAPAPAASARTARYVLRLSCTTCRQILQLDFPAVAVSISCPFCRAVMVIQPQTQLATHVAPSQPKPWTGYGAPQLSVNNSLVPGPLQPAGGALVGGLQAGGLPERQRNNGPAPVAPAVAPAALRAPLDRISPSSDLYTPAGRASPGDPTVVGALPGQSVAAMSTTLTTLQTTMDTMQTMNMMPALDQGLLKSRRGSIESLGSFGMGLPDPASEFTSEIWP